jgi:hypothetical protein
MAADSHGDKNEPQYAGSGVPQDAADLTEVAAYAAKVGNRKVGTVDLRNAAIGTAEAWEGLEWYDLTDGNIYLYVGGGWVPTIGDTGWINPTFLNGGNAGGNPAAQYRRRNGIVYMTGFWVPTANSEIQFRLPPGFRPLNTLTFWCDRNVAGGPGARMEVQAGSGSVIYRTTTIGTGAVNYAPITFPADA